MTALGVDLGAKLRPAGGKNPTGFFEDQDFLRISKRLKRALGIRGDSLRLLDPTLWDRPRVRALHNDALAMIRARFIDVPLWGFKYARTLRMLPFWDAVFAELELDVRYVVALRNPLSVARSRAQLNPERGNQAWSDLEWLVNVVPFFDLVRGHQATVVDFDLLLADPAVQLERSARMLGLPIGASERRAIDAYASQFLQPGMRHSRFQLADLDHDRRVNWLVRQAYGWLHRVAHDEISLDEPALWQDWARIQGELQNLSPILYELDRLRGRLNRALWNPATPWQALHQTWRDLRSR